MSATATPAPVKTATTTETALSARDRAVLRAIAQGRCQLSGGCGTSLLIDGVCYCDQFAGVRLAGAGLIEAPDATPRPARLTAAGFAVLATF